MTIQAYQDSGSGRIGLFPVPIITTRAPVSTDKVSPSGLAYQVGQLWQNSLTGNIFMYDGSYGWVLQASSSGDIVAVAGTAAQVTVTTAGGVATVSLPAVITTPGSLTTTTTLTATSGNITATAGNFVSSTLGDGIMLNSGTASGTTAATLNGRVGQITITTPSIGAGAQFTFTITNSSVLASTTQVGYWLTGGSNGSALTIQSVTNSASSSVVVIQNSSGATANVASLVLTFLVLN